MKNMKIAVLCDSGSGLTKKEADELGIYYLPLQVECKGASYLDGIEITTQEVYKLLQKGEMPSTSMPRIGMIEETLQGLKDDGYNAILFMPLSSGLSSTCAVVESCAKQIGISLYTVDVFTTCAMQRYIAMCAKELVDQRMDLVEILNTLKESIEDSNTLIIPDDLMHLKRGGRLTPMAAALGSLLKIKPVLQLNEKAAGKIDTFDKVRTMSKALKVSVKTFRKEIKNGDEQNYIFAVLHSGNEEGAVELEKLLNDTFDKPEILTGLIGPVISAHTGLGCLGMQYIKKVPGTSVHEQKEFSV